jgi:hypothetical protein
MSAAKVGANVVPIPVWQIIERQPCIVIAARTTEAGRRPDAIDEDGFENRQPLPWLGCHTTNSSTKIPLICGWGKPLNLVGVHGRCTVGRIDDCCATRSTCASNLAQLTRGVSVSQASRAAVLRPDVSPCIAWVCAMTDLRAWLASLSTEEVQLFNIVFEKLLLAGVVAMAGAIFALLLERYKSGLKKQEELTKKVIPRILEILEKANSLYTKGTSALSELNNELSALEIASWIDALWEDIKKIEVDESADETARFPKSAADLNFDLKHRERGTISILDLLRYTATTDRIRCELDKPDFLDREAHYESSGLLHHLPNILRKRPENRGEEFDRSLLFLGICRSVFIPVTAAPREEFETQATEFSRAMILYLPAENRKQKRAQSKIAEVLRVMRDTMNDYPAHEVKGDIEIGGIRLLGAAELIAQCYRGLVTQLRIILYAI